MTSGRKTARERVAHGIGAWERDDFETALGIFGEILEEHPYFADVHNRAGLCAAMLGMQAEALEYFEAAIAQNPQYAEAHMNRGIVLNEMGRHGDARDAFQASGSWDSSEDQGFPSELGNRIAVAHGRLGDLYFAGNRLDEAVQQYEAALAIRPDFMDIRGKFAECLIETGAYERARDELTQVLEARPSFVEARIRMGVVLRRVGDSEGAIREWSRCAREDPSDSRPRAYLASVVVDHLPATDS